jgi:hypothetical protein
MNTRAQRDSGRWDILVIVKKVKITAPYWTGIET